MPHVDSDSVRDSGSSATPLVDSVLTDPLRAQSGVGTWLRAHERRLREAATLLSELVIRAVDRGTPLATVVREAAERVERMLSTDGSAGLSRILRRPSWQLGDGSIARRGFDRAVESVTSIADTAVAVQDRVDALHTRIMALEATSNDRFPNFVSMALTGNRVTVEDVTALTQPSEGDRMHDRLTVVESKLAAWVSSLESVSGYESMTTARSEVLRPAELAATLATALKLRRERLALRTPMRGVTRTLVDHVVNCADASPGTENGSDYGDAATAQLFTRALRLNGLVSDRGAMAPHWGAALADVHVGQRASARVEAIRHFLSSAQDADEDAAEEAEESYYMIPLQEDLVLLSKGERAAVRVWSAKIGLDKTVEGVVVKERVNRGPTAVEDIAALFDGLEMASSGWYRVARRVRVRAIASFAGGWLGRLSERGTLHRTPVPAYHAVSPASRDIRVLRPPPPSFDEALRGEILPVAEIPGAPTHRFLLSATREACAGLEGDERVWLRHARNSAGRASIWEEAAFFKELWSVTRMRGQVLQPIGVGAFSSRHERWPLYRLPSIAELGYGGVVPSWIGERTSRVLEVAASMARLMVGVHEAGWIVGLLHPEALAYGIESYGRELLPVPGVMLAYAPFAARIGEPLRSATLGDGGRRLYRSTNAPSLDARMGATATQYVDYRGLALCILEFLSIRPRARTDEIEDTAVESDVPSTNRFCDNEIANTVLKQVEDGEVERLHSMAKWLSAIEAPDRDGLLRCLL